VGRMGDVTRAVERRSSRLSCAYCLCGQLIQPPSVFYRLLIIRICTSSVRRWWSLLDNHVMAVPNSAFNITQEIQSVECIRNKKLLYRFTLNAAIFAYQYMYDNFVNYALSTSRNSNFLVRRFRGRLGEGHG
jgi:hypothetical protein